MIILIAGSTHAGKTLFAQKLLEAYSYPYLSIDHLKMGLIRSGRTSLTPESDGRLLTDYLWPVVREMIKEMSADKAIIISTHILEEVDAVCTRTVIIADGQVVANGTPAELRAKDPQGRLDVVFRNLTMKEGA